MAENPHEMLRSFPVLPVDLPSFDDATTPHDPVPVFERWLKEAIEAQAPEPHVMTLSTTDSDGRPSSRALVCTDVSQNGLWYFPSVADRRAGHQPDDDSPATLTFHWPRVGRQISVRGTVAPTETEAEAANWPTRPADSHAVALISRHSTPLEGPIELQAAFEQAFTHLMADRGLIAPDWTLHALTAQEVEFCQADHERRQSRLCYERTGTTWRLIRGHRPSL
ncbi:pyridoxal 5'-phosphate synthase [Streptomyces sp. NPDC018338]|uniref:pyridoxine/pyridoxamine 5'-phosphate oxidase n=1 Tax=Streptomyces sp. NPDC018338 TaxID=3157192 RepID=UPI0033C0F6DA